MSRGRAKLACPAFFLFEPPALILSTLFAAPTAATKVQIHTFLFFSLASTAMSDTEDGFIEAGASDVEHEEAVDEPMDEEEDEADDADEEEEAAPASSAKGKKAATSASKKGAKAPSTTGSKKATPAKRSAASDAGGAAKKVKSITSDSAAREELTRYMRQQNRPYTALVIFGQKTQNHASHCRFAVRCSRSACRSQLSLSPPPLLRLLSGRESSSRDQEADDHQAVRRAGGGGSAAE